MKKIAILFGLALLMAACKDTPKQASQDTVSTPAPAAAPQAPAAKPEEIQEAAVNLTTGIKTAEDLRKKVDALPENVRKAKKAEIEGYYSTLEGLIEKQTMMLNEIKGTDNPQAQQSDAGASAAPQSGPIDEVTLKDYNESVSRYAKDAQQIQEAIDKMSGKKQ